MCTNSGTPKHQAHQKGLEQELLLIASCFKLDAHPQAASDFTSSPSLRLGKMTIMKVDDS